MKKRMLAALLALVLLVSLLPASVLAEGAEQYHWALIDMGKGDDGKDTAKLIITVDKYELQEGETYYKCQEKDAYHGKGQIGEDAYGTFDPTDGTTLGGADPNPKLHFEKEHITSAAVLAVDGKKVKPTSTKEWFSYLLNCKTFDFSGLDTSEVTDMGSMFLACTSVQELDLSDWDTSKVTTMRLMFRNKYVLRSNGRTYERPGVLRSLNVSTWDTSNVTDMYYTFYECDQIENLDLSNWNIGKVQNFESAFNMSRINGVNLTRAGVPDMGISSREENRRLSAPYVNHTEKKLPIVVYVSGETAKDGKRWLRTNTNGAGAIAITNGGVIKNANMEQGKFAEPTKPGYRFVGWYDCSGNAAETPSADTIYYAKWEPAVPAPETISALDGVVTVDCAGDEVHIYMEDYRLAANTYELGDVQNENGTYVLNGKVTETDGYVAAYNETYGEYTLDADASDMTFKLVWDAENARWTLDKAALLIVKRDPDGYAAALPGLIARDKALPKLNTRDHFAYVQGYPDGTVRPNGSVTRAETAAILFRLMDASSRSLYYSTASGFRDVDSTKWYNTYVATLNNAGVITDSRDGYFRPDAAITRAELAAMLAQFAEQKSAAIYFSDVSAGHWAAKAIALTANLGWINGYPDGTFGPDKTVTRAELMAMINRATGRAPKSTDALLTGMKTWKDNANTALWYYLDVQEATNSHSYAVNPTEYWTGLEADPNWAQYE